MLRSWIYTRHNCIHLSTTKIKPVNPKGNQAWIFIGRTGWSWSWSSTTLATWSEALVHWKDPDVGKDWGQEEKGTTEDEMTGWHHQLSGHEFEQSPRDSEGQESLASCSPRGHKELDTTEQPESITRLVLNVHGSYVHNTKTWKQPKGSSRVKKINKLWCSHTTEFHLAMKKDRLLPPTNIWINLSDIILRERARHERA